MVASRTILVIAEQPARLSLLAVGLRAAGFTVITTASATALETYEGLHPAVVVMDGRFARTHAMVLPSERLLHGGTRFLFLTQPPPESEMQHWVATLEGRGLKPVRVDLPSPAEVAAKLVPLLTPEAIPRPMGAVTDVEAAAFLVGLWARNATGVVSAPLRSLEAKLYEGDAADEESRRVLVRMMYEGGLTFARTDLPKPAAPRPLAADFWEAARRATQPELALSRMDNMLVERPAGRRVQELPLPRDLAKLLGLERERRTLGELCNLAGVQAGAIAAPLSALVRLGFFHLRPVSGMATGRYTPGESTPPPPPPPPVSAVRTAAPPSHQRQQLVVQRLEREWRVLADAEDRAVLGLPADASPDLIEQAIARQSRRYSELRTTRDLPPEGRELAEKILARVEQAATAMRSNATLTPEAVSQPEVAFRQGLRAMQSEAWPEACQWFRSARILEPRSALYVGYLGWAIFNNTLLARESRRHKALELLKLAEASAEPVAELQIFLATVEAENGDIDQAFARVNRVLTKNPQHREARALDARLRAAHSS